MIQLSAEQQRAYDRFIKARDKVGLVRTKGYGKRPYIPQREYTTVDVENSNHPMFEKNLDWFEYLEASSAWWAIEPDFRKTERMSAIAGDYETSDSWGDETTTKTRDTYSILMGEL